MKNSKSTWLKNRGYLHISPQIDVHIKKNEILSKLKDPDYIAKHAFYPLIHSIIKERRFKYSEEYDIKSHSHNGIPTKKLRPLHYATHIDALIFGYYAELLQKKYEQLLNSDKKLSECITAYRKIDDDLNEGKFKSTINFANEVFNEIRLRTIDECIVLKFDIKSFFSTVNHTILKEAWAKLINSKLLPPDHFNVFKASTRFSYILKDDLRINQHKKGRRLGFDEKKLATIRKSGIVSFFESNAEFREQLKNGTLKLHKYPFRDKLSGKPIGIPQGLPISAVLANLYLLEFDKKILKEVVDKLGGYYRRYSDDIIIICKPNQAELIDKRVKELILESKVVISDDKTEKFLFKRITSENFSKTTSIKITDKGFLNRYPFTYLGFEFNGEQVLIKSANLAKFYRRMITAVKRKVNRAVMLKKLNPGNKVVIYRNQLIRLYSNISLDRYKIINRRKTLVQTKYGYYVYHSEPIEKKFNSNYFSYVRRSSSIMQQPCIQKQVKKHKGLFNATISYHIKKNLNRN
ncbi:reverse transcriptase domain-containing protein [Pedobacter frigiditerrae]|uniref:reverse transcriptase domain-containing protein n=1 Tax=Pedobacter frigiditerrae TaxID=2530452 RepID=UPI0029309216|nr:reverse transcriptase domain-containing protein [Pedobacter frigiditerrae]